MTTPSPIGPEKQEIENMAKRHRFGKVWRDMDGNKVEPVTWLEWVGLGLLVAGIGAWVVWG